MNGDQLQYEIDNANTPPEQRSDWPLPTFDARDWAKAFCVIAKRNGHELDEGWMITWFANALMRGYDEHAKRQPPSPATDCATCAEMLLPPAACPDAPSPAAGEVWTLSSNHHITDADFDRIIGECRKGTVHFDSGDDALIAACLTDLRRLLQYPYASPGDV